MLYVLYHIFDMVYAHTYPLEYYTATNKNEFLPFVTWMNLHGIILSEISSAEKNKCCTLSLIRGM